MTTTTTTTTQLYDTTLEVKLFPLSQNNILFKDEVKEMLSTKRLKKGHPQVGPDTSHGSYTETVGPPVAQ